MREVDGKDKEQLTFFMYEEIDAFRRAAIETGLGKDDVEAIFYRNAVEILSEAGFRNLS